MIAFFDLEGIREVFFLAVRFIIALAGFAAGYFLTGPIAQTLAWLIKRRQLPDWVLGWLRLSVGLIVALVVFYYVPIGGDGWGGRGSGGGLGDNKGSGKDTAGTAPTQATDKGTGAGTDTGKETAARTKLVIDLLGEGSADAETYYRIDRKEPGVSWETLKAYIETHKAQIESIEILITPKSVSRQDVLVEQVRGLAGKLKIPSLVTPVAG